MPEVWQKDIKGVPLEVRQALWTKMQELVQDDETKGKYQVLAAQKISEKTGLDEDVLFNASCVSCD